MCCNRNLAIQNVSIACNEFIKKNCMNFCEDFIPKLAFLQVNDQTRDQTKVLVALEKSNDALIANWLTINVYLYQIWISWQMDVRLLVAMTTLCQTIDTSNLPCLLQKHLWYQKKANLVSPSRLYFERKARKQVWPCCRGGLLFKARLDYVSVLGI